MEEPTLEQLTHMVGLMNNPSAHGKDAAEQARTWLKELQHQPTAWTLADQALLQGTSIEVVFFAAQTIKNKIERSFRELPANVHTQLRQSTLDNLKKYSIPGSEAIAKQLAISIADLALQMFPGWANPVVDLIAMLGGEHETRCSLLEILAVIPEEVENWWLPLTHEEREAVSYQVGLDCGPLFDFLVSCSAAYGQDLVMLKKMFRCMASWLSFGGEGTMGIETKPLLPMAFEVLKAVEAADLHDDALDAICAALKLGQTQMRVAHGIRERAEAEQNPAGLQGAARVLASATGLNNFLSANIMALKPLLEHELASWTAEVGGGDRANMLVNVFVELADCVWIIEATVKSLFGQQTPLPIVEEVLDVIMKCVQQQDYDILSLTFNFWYFVADGVEYETGVVRQQLRELRTAISRAPDPATKAQLEAQIPQVTAAMYQQQAPFAPYYNMLYQMMLQHSMCPADLIKRLDTDDDLSDRRERVHDVISETAFVIGTEAFLEFFWARCQTAEGTTWQGLEANLWMMNTVVAKVEADSVIAPQLLTALAGIGPETHDQLYYTALKVTGSLSAWAANHPEKVPEIWELLIQAIRARKHVGSVVGHIKYLCRTCRAAVAPHLGDLKALFDHADSLGLKKIEVLVLFEGAARVVAHLPADQIPGAMKALTGSVIATIEQALAQGQREPLITGLSRLAVFLKRVNIPRVEVAAVHPLEAICTEIFAALVAINARCADDAVIVEESNRVLQHIITKLDVHGAPLAPKILESTTELFSAHKHCSCLNVARKTVKVFGTNPQFAEGMTAMVRAMCGPTFTLLGSPETMAKNADVAEDFFGLCTAVLKTNPQVLLGTELGEPAFALGVAGVLLDDSNASERMADMMVAFLSLHESPIVPVAQQEAAKQIVLPMLAAHGGQLVYNVIVGATGQMKRHFITELSDVLFNVHRLSIESCYHWVQAVLQTDLPTLVRVSPQQKAEFLEQFRTPHESRSTFRDQVLKPFQRLAQPREKEDDDPR